MSSYDPGSFNKSGLFIFLFSFGFSILFIVAISFMHPGVENLDQIRTEAKQAAADSEEASQKAGFDEDAVEKPWISSEELVQYGKKQYQANCVACHMADGKGGGPIAARNLVEGDWQKGGSSIALYKTLQNGIEGTSMASFAHLSKVKRWALVHYVRSITENKVEDDMSKLEEFGKNAE